MRTAPTGRGIALAGAIVALVVLAVAWGIPELLGLATAGLLLALVGRWIVSGGGPIRFTSSPPARVERASGATVPVRLEAARAHRRGLRIVDDAGTATAVVWGPIGPQADIPIPTDSRGPVSMGPWTIDRVDPWGLWRRRIAAIPGCDLLVVPRVRPVSLASLPVALAEYRGSTDMGTTTFATLREYVIGDELRHVHWRSSAKVGTLMMRQYVDVTRPHVQVILVADPRAHLDADDFEATVDLTASLAAVASASGLDVEVAVTTGERVSHGRGRGNAVLDMLATVRSEYSPPDPRLVRGAKANTLVVCGNGQGGWWDRIPSMAVMHP